MRSSGRHSILKLLAIFVLSYFCAGCKNKEAPNQRGADPKRESLVRIEDHLSDESANFDSIARITGPGLERFATRGWRRDNAVMTAVEKEVVIRGIQSSATRIRFRLRAPEKRQMDVQYQGKRIAAFLLNDEWRNFELTLTGKGGPRRQVKFIFPGQNQENQAGFAQLEAIETPSYGWKSVEIAHDVRPSLILQSPSRSSFQLQIPKGKPRLTFGIGLQGNNASDSPLTFKVVAQNGSDSTQLFQKNVTPSKQSQWIDSMVDLNPFAGKSVRLSLITEASEKGVQIAWSSPEIYDSSIEQRKPNVILFSVDTLRADRISYYGYKLKTTPNLDALAGKSIVYKNAFCTFPGTLPSHTAVMTGLYSSHHHVGHTSQKVIRTKRIDPEFTTLAELAHDSGYITAGITDGGFVSNFYGFQQGFQQYIENTAKGSMESIRTIENALSWLKQKQQRPFFLFLHTYRVHEPFSPSVDSFKSLFPDWPVKDSRDLKVPMDWLSKVVNGKIIPTEKEKEFVRHCYDAEVHFFDRQFGRFMNELKRMKLDQDTVILIFGDHGEQLFDRGNGFGHGKTLLPEEIRVPLILYVPGNDHQDKMDLASLVDIYPTLAQLMGSKFQHSIDGMSLLEPSESKRRNNRVVYYEVNYGTEALWGIQSRHEKLVFDSQRKMEVYYDLTKDPFENGKLTAANRGVPKLMKQLLGSYISQSLAAQPDTNTGDLKENRELEEELRALGYIN